jgi:hypothetical protein
VWAFPGSVGQWADSPHRRPRNSAANLAEPGRAGSRAGGHYLRSVGADDRRYYSELGDAAGAWLGGGATDLGLHGQVQDQALPAVPAGYEPGARPAGEVTERINQQRERLGLAPVDADSQDALDIAARETRAAKLRAGRRGCAVSSSDP